MKKYYLFVLTIISISVMLVNCNGNASADKNNVVTEGNINGHDWVDLGLPSGTKWATCNVGANAPEEFGDYFAWAETEPKENYLWENYKYMGKSGGYCLTKYCNISSYGDNGFVDNKTVLDPSDDAATANWGEGWRMPTVEELQELFDKCTWMMKTNVFEVKGPNGKSILLPIAGYRITPETRDMGSNGYYWTCSLSEKNPTEACTSDFSGRKKCEEFRYNGQTIRPVCAK